jgi:GSCFA family
MSHPYTRSAPYQRWRKAMVEPAPGAIDPMVASPWRIGAGDRIATAGSCFAQHLVRRLRAAGIAPFETEPPHPMLSAETAEAFGYGLFGARFGSIYTARQLLQLLRRAYGRFVPLEDVWPGDDGAVFDPFRPTIQPRGFPTQQEYALDRRRHFAAVRTMFEALDVFVFTLGLTECWADRRDGAVYPLCPGVAAGNFDPEQHEFLNLGISETIEDLDAFLAELRAVNPAARLILTVSPVPLAATAEPRHVWTATSYSKSVLRVAAEEMARRPGVIYFPSYEIITAPAARGAYFEPDLRSISEAGVDHVMRIFFRHLVDGVEAPAEPVAEARADPFLDQAQRAVDVLCDEARLDPA